MKKQIAPMVVLRVDDTTKANTGIAIVYDYNTGTRHSCHPNIATNGSIKAMKFRGYWDKKDRIVKCGSFYYNTSVCVIGHEYDEVARKECKCGGKH